MAETSREHRRLRGTRVLVCFAFAVVLALPALSSDVPRVVAVGDIHGAYDSVVEILRVTELIDAENRWIGGQSALVQTGDIVDRGGQVREVLDLFMSLEADAASHGGQTLSLLGNHELMNILGDLRDVSVESLAPFVDEESEARRESAYDEWTAWALERARDRGIARPQLPPDVHERWMEEHPPGLLEYWAALAPEGTYGRWLRERPVVVRLAGTLFMHAGLGPAFAELSIDEINALHVEALADYDGSRRELVEEGVILPFFTLVEMNAVVRQEEASPREGRENAGRREAVQRAVGCLDRLQELLNADSPLWYRGYSKLTEAELAPLASELRLRHGVRHFVAAHSPMRSATIWERLDGAFFLIDTGMLTSVYHGRPAALEIQGGVFSAVYPDDRQVVLDESEEVSLAGPASRSLREPTETRAIALAVWTQEAEPGAAEPPERRWYDVDGSPLPFQDDEEILDLLRTAPIVDERFIGEGVTKPKQLTLEQRGVRVHASFRYYHEEKRNVRLADGTMEMFFLDSYRNEVPSYELGRLLGMDNIPPTVMREVDGQEGSVQIWVEDSVTQKKRTEEGTPVPGHVVTRFNRQTYDMDVYDNLVRNIDRNSGNIIWDKDWNLWLIDCTRCFAQGKDLPKPDELVKVSHGLWERLRGLDEATLTARLGDQLSSFQIKALLARRERIVKKLEDRIRKQGEDQVLFDYDDPVGGVVISYDES